MSEDEKRNLMAVPGTYTYERDLLAAFAKLIETYDEDVHGDSMGGVYEGPKAKELRPQINHMLPAVEDVFAFVGINPVFIWTPPPMIGGSDRRIDLLTNIFGLHNYDLEMQLLLDCVQRAIGLLEHLAKTGRPPASHREGTVASLDLVTALERAVRQAFSKPPEDERQDLHPAIRVVLTSLKIPFTSEQERVAYGVTSAIPDFVLWEGKCALEVKLLKDPRDVSRIISEINDDIVKYGDRFSRKIFLVYDRGTLRDVEAFRGEFMKLGGVFVLVVKH